VQFSSNLAGSVENKDDKSVQFFLQGDEDQINRALNAIPKGTKKSSDVNVSVSPTSIRPDLKTFTVVGWTSVTRNITQPYDLVFNLRPDNTIISQDEAKEVWLAVCEKAVKGPDSGNVIKMDSRSNDASRTCQDHGGLSFSHWVTNRFTHHANVI
jgi:acylphosphatase